VVAELKLPYNLIVRVAVACAFPPTDLLALSLATCFVLGDSSLLAGLLIKWLGPKPLLKWISGRIWSAAGESCCGFWRVHSARFAS
jgi:hypothetical protein